MPYNIVPVGTKQNNIIDKEGLVSIAEEKARVAR
jgi:hypothetical protein